jgi:hypothetical protein
VFKELSHVNLPVEFLLDLSLEAMLQGFMRVNLAAGKFPAEAEFLIGRALGNEKPSLQCNEGRGYSVMNGFVGIHGTPVRVMEQTLWMGFQQHSFEHCHEEARNSPLP